MKLARDSSDQLIFGTAVAINYHIIKTLGFNACREFRVDMKVLLKAVEEYNTKCPLVASSALNCIGTMITQSSEVFQQCKAILTSKSFYMHILNLLSRNQII